MGVRINYSVILLPLLLVQVFSHPLLPKATSPSFPSIPSIETFNFMKQFGYLEEGTGDSEALYTEEAITTALKEVQKFGALPQTGIADNATLELMRSARCGVPDVIRNHRRKRYVLGSSGWKKRHITYFLANWSPKLGENIVAKQIQLALDTWGRYGRLRFTRLNDPSADIIVAFGRGPHGDNFPFDGPGNVIAHAFFPYEQESLGGDVHFDDDEDWTIHSEDSEDGTDFFDVAVHELGHSLGLAHSPVKNSIMFPYYKGYSPDFALDYDDVLAMYELYIRGAADILDDDVPPPNEPETTSESVFDEYTTLGDSWGAEETTPRQSEYPEGSNENDGKDVDNRPPWSGEDAGPRRRADHESSTVTYEGDVENVDDHKKHDGTHGIPSSNSPSLPDICEGNFDAVATLREELFVFKDQYIWRLKERHHIEEGYPVPIYQMFPKLPKTIKKVDAAYERSDGMIVLFTGDKYWVYNGQDFMENSPQPLSNYGLPKTLDKIDAVQIWGKNGKTYFYKNDRFWRYNEAENAMDPGYPKHMERWRGVPQNLDAATTWKDGYTYFFKDKYFWKFDNDWVIVTESSPLPAPQTWLGCPEKEDVRAYFSLY